MARTYYGYEKRQKELARLKKKEEKGQQNWIKTRPNPSRIRLSLRMREKTTVNRPPLLSDLAKPKQNAERNSNNTTFRAMPTIQLFPITIASLI